VNKVEIQVNSKTTSYWTNDLPIKENLLFLHGFRGNHKGLLKVTDTLKENFNIILPDLPGYGESEPLNKKHTFEAYASFLAEFSEAINFNKGVVIGHSFGASLALVFAAYFPNLVKSLYLIAPVISADTLEASLGKLFYEVGFYLPFPLRKMWLLNRPFDAISSLVLFKTSSFSKRLELVYDGQKNIRRLNEKIVLENFLSYYETDFQELAKKISMPTYVISGTKDSLCPESTLLKLVKKIKHPQIVRIPDEGHIIPLEQPRLLGNILSGLLSDTIKL